MRVGILVVSVLLAIGGLFLTLYGSSVIMDGFNALTEREQRLFSGGLLACAGLIGAVGAWIRHRKSTEDAANQGS